MYRSKFAITAAVLCLFANNVMADDSTTNLRFPSMEPQNYYGAARTDSFNRAIGGTDSLTNEQIKERTDLIPPRLNNRFYIRLGGNAAAEGATSLKNTATSNNFNTGAQGTLNLKQVKTSSNNFEIAFGYTWTDFAMDLEWLALKNIAFTGTITNITPNFTFNSTIKGDALLLNVFWTFKNMYNVQLYGVVNGSYSRNTSYNSINSGPIESMNRYYLGFGFGLGGRFNVISRLFADVSGRYLFLGNTRTEATNSPYYVYVKGFRNWIGMSFRLLWLL